MYRVIVHGSMWFESKDQLAADEFARLTKEKGPWSKVEVCKVWKRDKYTLTKRKIGFMLDDGFRSDWPIKYENGKFGFDNPEWWPPYIINWVKSIMIRANNGGN